MERASHAKRKRYHTRTEQPRRRMQCVRPNMVSSSRMSSSCPRAGDDASHSPIHRLYTDMVRLVCSFLSDHDLVAATAVCKYWTRCIQQPGKGNGYHQYFPPGTIERMTHHPLRHHIASITIGHASPNQDMPVDFENKQRAMCSAFPNLDAVMEDIDFTGKDAVVPLYPPQITALDIRLYLAVSLDQHPCKLNIFTHLRTLPVRRLEVRDTVWTAPALQAIGQITSLQTLTIDTENTNPEFITDALRSLINLTDVQLSYSGRLSLAHMAMLEPLPNLVRFTCTNITSLHMRSLARFQSKLQVIRLEVAPNARVSELDFDNVDLSRTTCLDLSSFQFDADESTVLTSHRLPCLDDLTMHDCVMSNFLVRPFPLLQSLFLFRCTVVPYDVDFYHERPSFSLMPRLNVYGCFPHH